MATCLSSVLIRKKDVIGHSELKYYLSCFQTFLMCVCVILNTIHDGREGRGEGEGREGGVHEVQYLVMMSPFLIVIGLNIQPTLLRVYSGTSLKGHLVHQDIRLDPQL